MKTQPNRSIKKMPPAISQQVLRNAAIQYLNRYVPSVQQFRNVLIKKVDRTIRARGEGDREAAMELINDEVRNRLKTGELDDRSFAQNWVRYLQNKGKSKQQIRSRLRQKGISTNLISEVLDHLGDVSFDVAVVYAKKRKFGPFRTTATDRQRKQKDMASMLRAGHPFDVVRTIMDCSTPEELERRKDQAR